MNFQIETNLAYREFLKLITKKAKPVDEGSRVELPINNESFERPKIEQSGEEVIFFSWWYNSINFKTLLLKKSLKDLQRRVALLETLVAQQGQENEYIKELYLKQKYLLLRGTIHNFPHYFRESEYALKKVVNRLILMASSEMNQELPGFALLKGNYTSLRDSALDEQRKIDLLNQEEPINTHFPKPLSCQSKEIQEFSLAQEKPMTSNGLLKCRASLVSNAKEEASKALVVEESFAPQNNLRGKSRGKKVRILIIFKVQLKFEYT